jgi:hypothetical protein
MTVAHSHALARATGVARPPFACLARSLLGVDLAYLKNIILCADYVEQSRLDKRGVSSRILCWFDDHLL